MQRSAKSGFPSSILGRASKCLCEKTLRSVPVAQGRAQSQPELLTANALSPIDNALEAAVHGQVPTVMWMDGGTATAPVMSTPSSLRYARSVQACSACI